jgi:phosphoribosylanthranilate isomerase
MTKIKVCGLTRAGDVALASELGAWACGFVLTESSRRISPSRARDLARYATGALTVAVVATETAEAIADALATAQVSAVQLSAGPDGPSVNAVRSAAARRGLRPLVIAAADTAGAATADFVLLDARIPGSYGGTGQTLDWDTLAHGDMPPRGRLVLAGGLDPGNVPHAIARLAPAAVDVCSGVEAAPGEKDATLLARFFKAVSQVADQEGVAS